MSTPSPRAKKDVGAHFDRSAPAFDAIYTGEGVSPLRRLVHRVFFHDIHWRLALTLAECDPLAGASVLDIGCGSWGYLAALWRPGAACDRRWRCGTARCTSSAGRGSGA